MTHLGPGIVVLPRVAAGLIRIACRIVTTTAITIRITDMAQCVSTPKICIPQGDERALEFTVTDADGNPADLSGANQIELAISRRVNSPTLLSYTLTGGALTIAANHILRATVTGAQSAGLTPGSNYYEIKLTNASGQARRLAAGILHIQDTLLE